MSRRQVMVDSESGRSEDSGSGEVSGVDGGEPVSGGDIEKQFNQPNWKPRSRQEEGRKSEKVIAKKLGAKLHPNSGALRIKHDASDKDTLYEIKDSNKSYSLSASELNTLWVRAVRESKEPVFIIKFNHLGITATITITKEQ